MKRIVGSKIARGYAFTTPLRFYRRTSQLKLYLQDAMSIEASRKYSAASQFRLSSHRYRRSLLSSLSDRWVSSCTIRSRRSVLAGTPKHPDMTCFKASLENGIVVDRDLKID